MGEFIFHKQVPSHPKVNYHYMLPTDPRSPYVLLATTGCRQVHLLISPSRHCFTPLHSSANCNNCETVICQRSGRSEFCLPEYLLLKYILPSSKDADSVYSFVMQLKTIKLIHCQQLKAFTELHCSRARVTLRLQDLHLQSYFSNSVVKHFCATVHHFENRISILGCPPILVATDEISSLVSRVSKYNLAFNLRSPKLQNTLVECVLTTAYSQPL